MPQNVASDQGLHCLQLIQLLLDTRTGSSMNLFKFQDKYGKELRSQTSSVLLTSFKKVFFCLAFYSKWKCFVPIYHILSETICLSCFCILFSNIYPKIKFMAKNWSDLCNFCSKVIFLIFVYENIFYFSFLNLNYCCFTTILWKFQKNWTRGISLKSASKLPTLQISA